MNKKANKKDKDPRLENFPKKWANVLDKICNGESKDTFLDDVQQATKEEINAMIVEYNELITEYEKDRDEDLDLQSKKEQALEAGLVYKEGISANMAKARYCVYIKKSL
jgi:hypothetical protein